MMILNTLMYYGLKELQKEYGKSVGIFIQMDKLKREHLNIKVLLIELIDYLHKMVKEFLDLVEYY